MSDILAGVYSRSDAFKRKLIDALRNPGATVDQLKGRMVDDLRGAREQISAATDEGVNYGPASRALAMKMAEAYNPAGMTKVFGPQSEALEIARQNGVKMLGLPEDNTAMDRAKALGFRVKDRMHHGTTEPNITGFRVSPHDETQIAGVSLARDPAIADFYARGRSATETPEGANILSVLVRGKKPQDFDKFVDYAIDNNLMASRTADLTGPAKQFLEKKNLGGFDMQNLYGDEVQVLNPSRIRSRFAAFDPARVNENDLLAGMLPLGAIALPAGGDNQGKKQARPQEIIDALRKKKD